MMQFNKRKINLLLFLTVCIFISITATKPSSSTTTRFSTTDTSLFKNLKILPKNISKDSLDKIMHVFNDALAVKCNFCHVWKGEKPDFASDEKGEKDVARYMMNMTAEMNAKYFNHENSTRPDTISVIKCVTCHHGSPHPGEMEAMNHEHKMPQPPPPPPHPGDSSKMPDAPPGDTSGKKATPPPQ